MDGERVMLGMDLIIVLSPLKKLMIDLFGKKIFSAKLFGLFIVKGTAGINIDGNKTFLGERMDHHRTFDQRHPAGKAGLIWKKLAVASENIGRRLLFHAQVINYFIQKIITEFDVIAGFRDAVIKIQQKLVAKNAVVILFLHIYFLAVEKNPFTNESTIENKSAHQKPSTAKPGTIRAASKIKSALMTSEKSPSVKIVIGRAKS